MLDTVLWALGTGAITGGIWVAILLMQRQRRLTDEQHELSMDVYRRLDELADVDRRVAELEERLEFAERKMTTSREPERLPRPGS